MFVIRTINSWFFNIVRAVRSYEHVIHRRTFAHFGSQLTCP